jgi:hypothetical protein
VSEFAKYCEGAALMATWMGNAKSAREFRRMYEAEVEGTDKEGE